MGALCKLQFSKPGKGTQQTSLLLKPHSIIVPGATAKRGSANTRKRWKPRRPHDVWRNNDALLFVRHLSGGDAFRNAGKIGARDQSQRISRKIRCKRQRPGCEGVGRTGWASWFVVGLGAHVLRGREESLNRRAA